MSQVVTSYTYKLGIYLGETYFIVHVQTENFVSGAVCICERVLQMVLSPLSSLRTFRRRPAKGSSLRTFRRRHTHKSNFPLRHFTGCKQLTRHQIKLSLTLWFFLTAIGSTKRFTYNRRSTFYNFISLFEQFKNIDDGKQ